MQELFGLPIATLMWILVAAVAVIVVLVAAMALRNPLIFKLGVRNIGRRKAQTVLIVTGLMLSTLIIATALGVGDTINYSANVQAYDDLGPIDVRADTSASSAGGGFTFGGPGGGGGNARTLIDEASAAPIVAQMARLGDVDGVLPALIDNVPVSNPASDLFRPAVTVHGLGDPSGADLASLTLADGTAADWAALGPDEAYINQALADQIEAGVGATLDVTVRGQASQLKVAGILRDGGLAGAGPTLVLPLAGAQGLLAAPGKLSTILISNAGDRERGVETPWTRPPTAPARSAACSSSSARSRSWPACC